MGYIKDINTAKRVALEEARILAKEYGFSENYEESKFVKEDGEMSDYDRGDYENGKPPVSTKKNSETYMSNPEEKREVQIGKEILNRTQILVNKISDEDWEKYVTPIQTLAQELIKMHGQ
jgi:hypothetical protein